MQSQAKLAESISVKSSLLNEIIKNEVIKGERGVNTEMALLMEAALNIPADLLLNLQSDYNMQMAKSDASLWSVFPQSVRLQQCCKGYFILCTDSHRDKLQ